MRVPRPAASTIAVRIGGVPLAISMCAWSPSSRAGEANPGFRHPRQVCFIPRLQRLEIWMIKVTKQITLDAWQMCQIGMLAVAYGEAREYAQNLCVPLGA